MASSDTPITPTATVLASADIALARAAAGRHGQSMLLMAPEPRDAQAVLDVLKTMAADQGGLVIALDGKAGEGILAPMADTMARWLNAQPQSPAITTAQRSLNGFKRAHNLDKGPPTPLNQTELGVADSGMADLDVPEIITAVAAAAKASQKPVLIAINHMDHLPLDTMGTVITALHKASQQALPVVLFGAGSSALLPMPANARSYAERMFTAHHLGPDPAPDPGPDPAVSPTTKPAATTQATKPTHDADQSPDPRAAGLPVSTPARSARPDQPKP
ncbi:MAG: hypothetical protein AAF213_00865 [Pseudomonadota bacterium]